MESKKKKNHIPVRLNVLFFVVFILFSAIILRLGVVQIVQGEEYQREMERTVNVTARIDAPRGIMLDRNGHVVVDNDLVFSITYTQHPGTTQQEKLEIAERLEKLIEVDTSKITERDLKDYWIITREEEALAKVSTAERRQINDPMAEYRLTLDRITEEELSEITEEELRVLAIKREFDRGYALSPQRVKVGVTYEEASRVIEHLAELPGIDILRDSQRKHPFGDTFKSFFGNTGQIPRDSIDYYLTRGYDRSDIVGTSFLEFQYEDVLRGQKAEVVNITDSRGRIMDAPVETKGQRGKDLVLTIDIELQQRIEQIIKEEVEKSRGAFLGDQTAYVVLMDPNTGEVLSLAGYNDHLGTVLKSFEMGSTVKGATVLTGFQTGVIAPNSYIRDQPITIAGLTKKSHTTMGNINDLTALEWSSNVYMFEIAMRIGNYSYSQKRGFANPEEAFSTMRYYFNQFGLGVRTGIDLPSEATGYNGGVARLGNLMDLGIGQFDTYTPLQLTQYISTIANGGYRIQPKLVREIREPSTIEGELGRVIHQSTPTVLNRIDMSDEHIARVQEGFRRVMHGSRGTARSYFANRPYRAAGKTGTAQVYVNGKRGNNQILGAYAPYDKPEVAMSVIVPGVRIERGGIANTIGQRVMDEYFKLKESRNGPNEAE
ncbi:peptidoglycan D,D-transpeptidase FtsI family protein [Anaerobacillus sp. MEB173]|uniref:peptidoglycan D,D-transpeptidase FtsI family protein n=1 Tax=Anaerobacillus sp. MEB173 TaxID=3383345 RepID=UPI003F911079